MSKGFHKKTSKRMPVKRRHTIEKKVREHNKKLKREMKKKNRHIKPKDPGIPNSLPFKDKVIKEAMEARKRDEQYKEMIRIEAKDRRKLEREKVVSEKREINKVKNLSDISNDALKRSQQFDAKNPSLETNDSRNAKNNTSLYSKSSYREFQKVIETADVVIEVLDARDPMGTRCPQVEEAVLRNSANKRLILLLNKVDLIPRDNLMKWLKYLRNELPTVAFKASTQSQNTHLSRSKGSVLQVSDNLLQSSKCLGADMLMKLLKNYCRNKDIKTSITVGIVGFPNVGKSSVINSLKRSKSCNVGATAGVTKIMQEIALDKHIKLLDCPGIVFANTTQTENDQQLSSLMALRNAIKFETMEDPISPIEAILTRIKREDLMIHYRIPAFTTVNEFLSLLAKRFGKLKKGGLLDLDSSARKVLIDWNSGKIKYYTIPPETQSLSSHISAEIVSSLSKEFDINDYTYDEEMAEIDTSIPKKMSSTDAFGVASHGFTQTEITNKNDDEMENMELEASDKTDIKTTICLTKKKAKKSIEKKEANVLDGLQLNKAKKLQFKRLKKKRSRDAKTENKLSLSLESAVNLKDDNYNFETDFM